MPSAKSSDHAHDERAKQGRPPAGSTEYLLAGQASELERLQLQSRVWEPSGRRLLEEIGDGRGARALDVGCGVLGWLRVLSEWVGPDGEVTGTDIDEAMLAVADRFAAEEGLRNVGLAKDDLFASELEPDSFDLVHARYEICPLGRGHEQMETYIRLARPGGTIVLEDPDTGSWHFNPPAPALERLIELIVEAFRLSGGDWGAGRQHLELLGEFGIEGNVRADVVALSPGHPYLRLPLQFAASLEERLLSLVTADDLEELRKQGEAELQEPGRWGTTFTLLQCWGRCAV
jgi:SAM-dependent methyltransferase